MGCDRVDHVELAALAALERQYSPSTRAADAQGALCAYADRSRAAMATLDHCVVPYGPHPDEWSIVFPVGPRAPLHVFVHGGYWQELTAAESLHMAPGFVERGIAFAAVNYTLAPQASLDDIVDQCRRAVASLTVEASADPGYDADDVQLSGHSAGAQLVAMVVGGDNTPGVRSAVLLSGVFDLEPLLTTSINIALGLDADAARRNSPLFIAPPAGVQVLVAVGEDDTEEFHRQSQAMAAQWTPGRPPLVVGGRDHFDVVFDVADPSAELGLAVDQLLKNRFK